MKKRYLLALVLASALLSQGPRASAEPTLTIGDVAPAIDVADWISLGKEKFKPVSKFEKGKVYVVEFWATWCGPCIMSMPHLAALQEKYADQGLQIVSVSDDDKTAIDRLMAKDAPNAEGTDKTYGDITSHYTVGSDPDRSTHVSYMESTRQAGIPAAFIVGRDGKLEWVGHPAELEEPLQAILGGTWDRAIFKVKFDDDQLLIDMDMEVQKVVRTIDPNDSAAIGKAVLAVIDKYESRIKTPQVKKSIATTKLDFMLQIQLASPVTTKLMQDVLADPSISAVTKHDLAWKSYELSVEQDVVNKELLQATAAAIPSIIAELTEDSHATVLDTLAHLQYRYGDLEAALKTAEDAYIRSGKAQEYATFPKQLREELGKK